LYYFSSVTKLLFFAPC